MGLDRSSRSGRGHLWAHDTHRDGAIRPHRLHVDASHAGGGPRTTTASSTIAARAFGGRFAQSLTLGVLVASVFTFGEEFGWTGYLLMRLLPLGRWRAALIYGAIWGVWHAPIIAGGFNYPGYPLIGPLMMCALTITFALTQTALRLRFDSVLLTSFFHASINTQGLGILPMFVIGVSPILGGITGLVGLVAFGTLGIWLLARTPEPLSQRVANRI
ncbi:MAG TPA: CPBP family intramembrane glutamic endopeptidase [Candidatus Angelobacter sp.]